MSDDTTAYTRLTWRPTTPILHYINENIRHFLYTLHILCAIKSFAGIVRIVGIPLASSRNCQLSWRCLLFVRCGTNRWRLEWKRWPQNRTILLQCNRTDAFCWCMFCTEGDEWWPKTWRRIAKCQTRRPLNWFNRDIGISDERNVSN